MPKLKTHRGAAKRFKKTASGKFKRAKAFKSHILTKKAAGRKRGLAQSTTVSKSDMQGVNAEAIRQGFADIGVKDNELLIFSSLMDAKSLFLTANADTVYFVGGLDLSKGPMPGKGWFTILRLYSPLEPFFDKSWRPSEIELVR